MANVEIIQIAMGWLLIFMGFLVASAGLPFIGGALLSFLTGLGVAIFGLVKYVENVPELFSTWYSVESLFILLSMIVAGLGSLLIGVITIAIAIGIAEDILCRPDDVNKTD